MVVQMTLAGNNGLLSACFCVMRRQAAPSGLRFRVTVYNPLTASSCWRLAAVLAEFWHDAVIGLPRDTAKSRGRCAAPPIAQIRWRLGSVLGISPRSL